MQFTSQMQAEMETIGKLVNHIDREVLDRLKTERQRCGCLTDKGKEICHAAIVELSPYKVRLENILCETDIKEQVH